MGITLVEIATNQYPYSGYENELELCLMIKDDKAPQLQGHINFSDNFKKFVEKCLQKDVEKRGDYKELKVTINI